ncbi:dihydropteroate synthase [Demetria terragena]|uniref:dihydropteroate synthase n=1 Tax=Demetria terragena TaxID=63959 RepID=UPI000364FA51|nr:dihydropteroate synthase [Demetria terragena]
MSLPQRPVDRPLVMGVVNVTPDSFSDGGRHLDGSAAVRHGVALIEQGADLLDIGGESTRPGARRVDEDEELRRVLPVVTELAAAGATVSVDTMRSSVAARAVDHGAALVNDVSGGLADSAMAPVVASLGVPFLVMHWRGHSHDMQTRAVYSDVVSEVYSELAERVEVLVGQGISRDRLVVDPGLGFAKSHEHNWTLLADLAAFDGLALPVLVGTSRKGFLGQIGAGDGEPVPAPERDLATAATSVLLAQAGVWGIRVHDVPSTRAAIEVVAAVQAARP